MKNKLSLLLIFCIFSSIVFIKLSDKNLGKNGNYGVVDWDNFGYYLYLPASFIYNDVKLQSTNWVEHVQKKYDLSTSFYQAHHIENGNKIIQYSSGVAIIYSPAFFIGHLIASISTNYPPNGFSKPYQVAILVETIFFVLLGLILLRALVLRYFSDNISSLIILAICLGTNYFQISFTNISSPHVILFCFTSAILYYNSLWHSCQKNIYSLLIGVFCGLLILSRPNEIIFLIIPLLWLEGDFSTLKDKIKFLIKHPSHLTIICLSLLIIGLIQPIYWHYVGGKWIFDSYIYEDFKFSSPYLIEYLFSYKKGWLIYTPIMGIGLISFIFLLKKSIKLFVPLSIFMFINIWILSSWDCWWYADSFSQRSIVQSYSVFAIPFGFLFIKLNQSKIWIKIPAYTIFFVLISFNLFQTFQFRSEIIHSQRMTKEYYWATFGDIKPNWQKKTLLEPDRNVDYLPEIKPKKHTIIFNNSFTNDVKDSIQINSINLPNEGQIILSKQNPYSKKISFPIKQICDTSYCFVVAKMRYKSSFDAIKNPFGINIYATDSKNGKIYKSAYKGVEHIDWFEKESWSSMEIVFIPPYLRNKEDSIHSYIWLRGDKEVIIDQFTLEVYDPSNLPLQSTKTYRNDFHTYKIGSWDSPKQLIGKGYNLIDSSNTFSSTFRKNIDTVMSGSPYTLSVSSINVNEFTESYAVISIEKDGNSVFYNSFSIPYSKNWDTYTFNGTLPNNLPKSSELKFYVWNKKLGATLIRDLTIKL